MLNSLKMKAINLLVCCFLLVIFMTTDAHSAPINQFEECVVYCELEDCLFLCDSSHDAHVSILNDIFYLN